MPIYTMRCPCGHMEDIYRSISAMNDDLPAHCGVEMTRCIVAPQVMTDISPYVSQIDGSLISSRSQHRNHLKSNGCIEVGNETSHLKNKGRKEDPRLKEMLIHTVNQKLSKHH